MLMTHVIVGLFLPGVLKADQSKNDTRHMKYHVSLRDLYGLCVNARTDSGKSLNQNQMMPGQIPGHIFSVFSGMAV